jgi:hypothetical protein
MDNADINRTNLVQRRSNDGIFGAYFTVTWNWYTLKYTFVHIFLHYSLAF